MAEKQISGNAKRAFKELASMVGIGDGDTGSNDAPQQQPVSRPVATASAKRPEPTPNPVRTAPSNSETVIGPSTVIEGSIRTDESVACLGTVHGDIVSKATVMLSGSQKGNLQAQKVVFAHATVEGNVVAESDVTIDSESEITGDIKAVNISSNGKINGSLVTSGLVSLSSNAVLNGDIHAGRIMIAEGAMISGNIKMESAQKK